MPTYLYKTDAGNVVISDTPPTDGRPCTASTSNGTYGMVVCESVEARKARDKARADAKFDKDMAEATRRAKAECEQKLGPQNRKLQEEADARLKKAYERWQDATKEVADQRYGVATKLNELNSLREYHDIFHDAVGFGIDLAGIVLVSNPYVAGALAVAGLINSAIKGDYADAALGVGTDVVDQFGRGKIPGAAGAPFVAILKDTGDLLNLFGQPERYPFSSPESLEAVKKIKDHFAKDPRNWMEKGFGPSKEALDKNLDDLVKAMEAEQAAQKALADEIVANARAWALGHQVATCIDKRESQLLHQR